MGYGRGAGYRLTHADRETIRRLARAGVRHGELAAAVGCSIRAVRYVIARTGGLAVRRSPRGATRLSLAEREEISRGVQAGTSCRALAARLHRAPSTISREVAAGGGRTAYRAWWAEERSHRRARRPRARKLQTRPRLRAAVEAGLRQRWSPQQIAARLVLDYPDDPEMRVSHETIYHSLYVQTRGALRKELTQYLRRGRVHRRSQARTARGGGKVRDMVLLSARPAAVADRAVPGHWEGDLIVGKGSQSVIATLVERQTRFTLLVRLPRGRHAEGVRDALATTIGDLPAHLRRSLTWDQGTEMAEHARFTIDTGVQVYFCDPRSPWQRGTNENTNGLIRQYLPRGTDLAPLTQAALDAIAAELNGRPRQTLHWKTPAEEYTALVR